MPALTMAAECRYAETGVGAAMAPGSQKWNGILADFDSAPAKIKHRATVTYGVFAQPSYAVMSLKCHTPVWRPKMMMPTNIAKPPAAVTISACVAERREEARSPEYATSRKDSTEVISQKTYINSRESEMTRPYIAVAKPIICAPKSVKRRGTASK